jgi:hypothetical protein
MPFASFASKLDSKRKGLLKKARLERWLVHADVSVEETYDRIVAVMVDRGYTYDYAERRDMYFSRPGSEVSVAVRVLRRDALEQLRSAFPNRPLPDAEATVVECFEQPVWDV